MARHDEPRAIRPSLLDRLIDDDPGTELDAPVTPRQLGRQLKLAIRRDLENLLNTRRRCLSCPAELEALEDSVLEYGIPDLSAAHLSSDDDQESLLRQVAEAIRRFEPRFKAFEVIQKTAASRNDRTVRFLIDAKVFADPAPEQTVFDSAIEPVHRTIDVKV